MTLAIALGASLFAGVLFALGPCGVGLHRKPQFVSKRNAGWECTRCHEVVFNTNRRK